MAKLDLISKIAMFIMFLCVVIAFQYYFTFERDECTSDPLVYAAKKWESSIHDAKAVGKMYFLFDQPTRSPIIYFDSNNISIVYE